MSYSEFNFHNKNTVDWHHLIYPILPMSGFGYNVVGVMPETNTNEPYFPHRKSVDIIINLVSRMSDPRFLAPGFDVHCWLYNSRQPINHTLLPSCTNRVNVTSPTNRFIQTWMELSLSTRGCNNCESPLWITHSGDFRGGITTLSFTFNSDHCAKIRN